MQLSIGRFDIARDAMLADAHRFGFGSRDEAFAWLDALLDRIAGTFDAAAQVLDDVWRQVLAERLQYNLALLGRQRQA